MQRERTAPDVPPGAGPTPSRPRPAAWGRSETLALLLLLAAPQPAWAQGVPGGVWLMPLKVAMQIFDCGAQLCGRIVWLQHPRDAAGQLVRDKENPDPLLQQRPLCGLTVIWGLRPDGPEHWQGGWLYNPDDGQTYRVKAELQAPDTMVARIYRGIPLFGQTWTMRRVPHLASEGWC